MDARDETVETKKGCRNEKRQPHAEGLGSVWTAAEETAARVQSQTPRQQFDKREPWLCWQQWISQHSGSLPREPRLSVSMCDESLQCCMCLKLPGPWSSGTGCDAVLKMLTLESAALLKSESLRSLPVGVVKGDA